METFPTKRDHSFSYSLYRLLLFCYPAEFRRVYAREMAITFRDCYREALQQHGKWGVARLWALMLYDLVTSLSVEHIKALIARWKRLFAIEEKQVQTLMSITFAQRTDIGRKRSSNEDSALSFLPEDPQLLAKKGALFIVADGLGGQTQGEVASQLTVSIIRDAYYHNAGDDIGVALRQAVEQANARIYQENLSKFPQPFPDKIMGSTCVVAVVQDDTLYVANVGDSRAYIIRAGQVKQVSIDHSVVAEQIRAGLLRPDQVANHPQRNMITRCLGVKGDVEVDIFTEKVQEGDLLLLCTDGLTHYLDDEELGKIVQHDDPQESVQHMIERANEGGGEDNITAVVAKIA
jgi:serine/threonine protein phosphatase PrpC